MNRELVLGSAPGHGVAILSMGTVANRALESCGLGIWFHPQPEH